MILLISVWLMTEGVDWHIRETGIFQPLRPHEIMIRDNGEVFIRNFSERRIQHYDPEGDLIGTIGRKGNGPGEFTFPVDSWLFGNRLYVLDMLNANISEFQLDGTFVRQFDTPKRGLDMIRTDQGWIFGDWASFATEGTATLMFADPTFQNPRLLQNIENAGKPNGMWVMSTDDKTSVFYSPIAREPKFVAGNHGKLVFLSDSEAFKVHVLDGSGKKIRTLSLDDKRIPFDVDWADEKLKKRLDNRKEKLEAPIQKLYPEYFPGIRNMVIDPDGLLVIDRWRGRPDNNHYPVALTFQGKRATSKYTWKALARLMGVHNGHGYVSTFDTENEEAGLIKIPLADINRFVESNPIVYDGPTGYRINISD